MNTYFNIRYEFDRKQVLRSIANRLSRRGSEYICVADGVILNNANRNPNYLKVVNGSMFAICDSSYVPLYIRWIYGVRYKQYCGSQIFMDIVRQKKYRMFFMGTSSNTLRGLKANLSKVNEKIRDMTFYELPYLDVDEFDYEGIAEMVEKDHADIIWVALGAPKQEIFMSKLKPYLHHGVMIAVGAAFKFYSGNDEKRAPQWMLDAHLEFLYRIYRDPKKQLKRCAWILYTLPKILYDEWRCKKAKLNRQNI